MKQPSKTKEVKTVIREVPPAPTPWLESFVKENGRLIAIAIVSYLAVEGATSAIVETFIGTRVPAEVKLQIVGVLTFVVKAIDRALHESQIRTKGLTNF